MSQKRDFRSVNARTATCTDSIDRSERGKGLKFLSELELICMCYQFLRIRVDFNEKFFSSKVLGRYEIIFTTLQVSELHFSGKNSRCLPLKHLLVMSFLVEPASPGVPKS